MRIKSLAWYSVLGLMVGSWPGALALGAPVPFTWSLTALGGSQFTADRIAMATYL